MPFRGAFAAMTLAPLFHAARGDGAPRGFVKEKVEGNLVRYSGSVTVEGRFTYAPSAPFVSQQVCFRPTDRDAPLVPRHKGRERVAIALEESPNEILVAVVRHGGPNTLNSSTTTRLPSPVGTTVVHQSST